MTLSTVSEILSIHEYESKTLTKAFAEITDIKVNHQLMDEALLVDKIEVEIQSGKPIYDFWMNDSDFIGTHPRYNDIVGGSLTDFMANDGKEVTNPGLDLKDFIGLSFRTFTDGKLYQLPDQQFANLYWFRYDWFQKPELAVDAERRQRARLWQDGASLVAERLQGDLRRSDAAASDGRRGPRPGLDHGAARKVRHSGQTGSEDEPGKGLRVLVRQGGKGWQSLATAQAGQREAAGRHHRL
jgi:ABC-type glycerol-3-phosphate transport system substrate-binding protein